MSRAETTAMLSKLVEKRLRNQTAFWASDLLEVARKAVNE